jgi:hypothetical protein
MDPLSLAGAFANIVGLISNFKTERSGAKLSDFMDWLREQHHDHLAAAISQNKALSAELSTLFKTNHEDLVSRLTSLNQQISQIANQIEGFGNIAKILSPVPSLSPQALSVLNQVVESGAKFVMVHKVHTGGPNHLLLIGGATAQVQYDDARFIEEDLETMVRLDLLRLEFTSKGERRFLPTRAGVDYVRHDIGNQI